tara:strand:- start:635 stop:1756 length:1122 start_codon:yes stop_codon:yes gene_type:complete
MMIRFCKIGVLLLFAVLHSGVRGDLGKGAVRHPVEVAHPGADHAGLSECLLVQLRGVDGQSDEFHMDVDSVYCGDHQCAVVPVRLVWDELGFYKRFELEPGIELEKGEGEPFLDTDYEQLHRVLSDRESTLWNVPVEQYTESSESEIDGVSGATVILGKSQYVAGAVWTCFNLWNWANGDVGSIIQEKTAEGCSLDELQRFLKNGSRRYKIFALEALTNRGSYDPDTLEIVLSHSFEERYDLQRLILNYVENAGPNLYFSAIQDVLDEADQRLRVMCLGSLLMTDYEIPKGCCKRLSERLFTWDSYQEIDLLLKIVESKSGSDPAVVSRITRLLDHSNFMIAHRAYWFLIGQKLSLPEEEKLEAFSAEHGNRL